MKKLLRILLSGLVLSGGLTAMAEGRTAKNSPPVKFILDTDMGNDVDDALALALIHALQNRGACELLAVTLTHPDPQSGAFVDAINSFYGRGNIPIGISPDAPNPNVSKFLKVAAARNDQGALVFPHDFDAKKASSSLSVLRRTLAAAEDESVVLVQVGFFTNFAKLLGSPADAFSPLTGTELIRKKVKFLSLMGGAFQTVNNDNRICEFNVRFDVASAQTLVADWPTPIVWSGMEIGIAIPFPASAIDHDYNWAKRHPVSEAYQLYNPTPHERPTWDLTSVLYAVYPDKNHFALSAPGTVKVEPDGFTSFKPTKGKGKGRDRFMIVSPEQAARVRGLFEALCTEPVPTH